MADDIVDHEVPAVGSMQTQLMKSMSQLRMMRTYIETHISTSTDGPNDGDAGPDLINGCDSVVDILDDLYNDLDNLDAYVVRPFYAAHEAAAGALLDAERD